MRRRIPPRCVCPDEGVATPAEAGIQIFVCETADLGEADPSARIILNSKLVRLEPFVVEPFAELEPEVTLVRLFGMLFPLNKAFLLPSAFEGIRLLKKIYVSMEGSKVLVVGHTDTTGLASRNRSLSLQRAEAVIQFMTDDAEAWLQYYTSETDFSRRSRRRRGHSYALDGSVWRARSLWSAP